jgi:small subunit ribosomal protein S1
MLQESFLTNDVQEGAVVKGKVVGIEKDVAIIDIGLKTEGRVALKEFMGPNREQTLKIGDEVEVYLDRVENALGEAVISRDKARREESWVKLERAYENREKVMGTIFNTVKGGYTVDLDGAVAFLPRSQVDIRPIRDVGPLMVTPQPFEILKMDRRRGNIVVSRRTVLEETRAEARSELVASLEEGQVTDGVVKNITEYGAFVDLGGIDGLLHGGVSTTRPRSSPSARASRSRSSRSTRRRTASRSASSSCWLIRGRASPPAIRSAPSSRAASPTSPTTARSWNWSRASKASSMSRR